MTPLAVLLDPLAAEQLDCLFTGLCRRPEGSAGPAPGLMFLALGLLWAGVWGWRRLGSPSPPPCGAPPPPDVLGN